MKKIVYILFFILFTCSQGYLYPEDSNQDNFGVLPSEITKSEIEQKAAPFSDINTRSGPPTEGSGGGGAVGTPLEDASLVGLALGLFLYVCFKNKDIIKSKMKF